ncbi:DNA polymerase III subunit beta [Sphingomonas sp. SRS2]|uniref:DNA polymerase III subunit beta n=1 Tax=Sphingomonas sp. SRS2 TaxID=133190 RepID=UPI000618480F|nr:DNA polymerase III subunit beta [Sphingomonas sp. SRS2]KKC24914.1 DNA polymerase III subunit beta [Sphingomonas sp. SRS2]
MKLTIERAGLLAVLGQAKAVVERRNTTPILANVLLDAGNGFLRVTASDLDIEIVLVVEAAAIDMPGRITADANMLFDIARKLPEGCQIALTAADGKLAVTGGRARFSLQTLPAEDFPTLISGDMPTVFSLSPDVLKGLIDKTRFAISTEETRYYLNGIYFHLGDGGALTAAATDGHRLAVVTLPEDADLDGEAMPDIIIPRKAVGTVRKMLDGLDKESLVEIGVSSTKIRFHLGDAVLTAKLIDGQFPDYTRVIPRDNEKLLRVDPAALALAVDRVATIATEKTRSVKFTVSKDLVTLSVTSPEFGVAVEEVVADYGDAAIEMGFNARYLLDVLAQVGGDSAEMLLSVPAVAALIRQHEGAAATFVIMPMRV